MTQISPLRTLATGEDVREILRAVGLDPTTTAPETYDRSFADLDLDSLARLEVATRVQDRFGVDVEADITAHLAPSQIAPLINARLGGGAS